MKKIYQSPEMNVVNVSMSHQMLAGSNGVVTGSDPGKEFNSSDKTYSRQGGGLWDDED